MTSTTNTQNTHSSNERNCTRCGKSVDDLPYEYWLFSTCKHCSKDADGRYKDTGSSRKWQYFPRWHLTQHPELPAHKRNRFDQNNN